MRISGSVIVLVLQVFTSYETRRSGCEAFCQRNNACWSKKLSSSSRCRPLKASSPSSDDVVSSTVEASRRSLFERAGVAASILSSSGAVLGGSNNVVHADEVEPETESFASISARASKMSQAIAGEEEAAIVAAAPKPAKVLDTRSAYDFSLPIAGVPTTFSDLIQQDEAKSKVKAIIVVNIKQDDPQARKNIPELISLAAKYGRTGEFHVVATPTDQGYFEPDTSALIRLKLASEYGYGINPVTHVTDKLNLLGTGANDFWRWIQGTCRTPEGLGKIQANFEKFLVDGRTGLPVRRYPRKYQPLDMEDDIQALLAGKPIPPARANFLEEWRVAKNDADRDTYRFQKGLNVFDQ